ncbi:hypothetical protein AB7459_17030, partial [Providencia rettgeri]
MTVSTEISSNEYTGNGVTTDFDYKFRIFKANQLSVIISDADGDNVVTLRLGTDYIVTGENKSAGGKVILTKPLANGHKISIARDIPITQETSFRNQSKFLAETHENAFDYLTMLMQRLWGRLGLFLSRPSILASWFDAKGYRIANLGKPKSDSDAVDFGTLKDEISGVNGTILKREKRLLRVDDIDIAALPKANDRAGNVLTFDKDGKPTVVSPASGSAVDVLNRLAASNGSSLITYTNPNGPGMPMPLDVRIGQVYFMSDFGVSPNSTAAENTARINATFAALSGKSYIAQFIFDCKGDVYVNGTLLPPDNTDIIIEPGTNMISVAGTNRPIFASQYWYTTIANPSDLSKKSNYLGIHGGGEVNYNKSGTAPGGLNTHAICIAGVKRLKLGGGLKVGGAFKYAYLVANIDYLDAQNLQFDNGSDGLHLQPPIYHAYVRNLRGHTGDDLFAMTGGDYRSYDLGTRGDFTFIDVKGLYNDNTLCAVKIAGNDGVEFKHVSVKGIYGSCQHAVFRIWADHDLLNTIVRHVSVDEVAAIPQNGHALCELYDRGLGKVSIDNFSVKNVSTNLAVLGVPVVDVRASIDLIAYNIDMDVPRNSKVGFACGDGTGNDKSRVFNLNIKSNNTALPNDQLGSLCLVTRGVVDNVNIKGSIEYKGTLPTLCQQRGGVLHNVTISDVVYTNGHIFRQFAANTDGSTP